MARNEKTTGEKVADRLSGNGIVKAKRICIDGQVTEFSEPVDFEEAKIGLNHVDQEPVDNIYILEDSRGNVKVSSGETLSEESSKKIVEEFL